MNRLISIFSCCLLKKILVITTNLTNPESAFSIICLTKSTCIAIKLLVQLLLCDQKKKKIEANGICLPVMFVSLEDKSIMKCNTSG